MPAPKGNRNARGNRGGKGGPSAYKPAFVAQAAKACQAGFTDREIAELFGVAESTINRWKVEHVEFSRALKVGKHYADQRVERSLYQRAVGYAHPDVHASNYQGEVTLTPITKHYPPDTVACIFWLKNRQPEVWRDKQEVEHSQADLAEILKAARDRAGISEETEH